MYIPVIPSKKGGSALTEELYTIRTEANPVRPPPPPSPSSNDKSAGPYRGVGLVPTGLGNETERVVMAKRALEDDGDDNGTEKRNGLAAKKRMRRTECSMCCTEVAVNQFPKLPHKGATQHDSQVCLKCWEQHLETEVEAKPWDQVSCQQCSQVLEEKEIRRLASSVTYRRLVVFVRTTIFSNDTDRTSDGLTKQPKAVNKARKSIVPAHRQPAAGFASCPRKKMVTYLFAGCASTDTASSARQPCMKARHAAPIRTGSSWKQRRKKRSREQRRIDCRRLRSKTFRSLVRSVARTSTSGLAVIMFPVCSLVCHVQKRLR